MSTFRYLSVWKINNLTQSWPLVSLSNSIHWLIKGRQLTKHGLCPTHIQLENCKFVSSVFWDRKIRCTKHQVPMPRCGSGQFHKGNKIKSSQLWRMTNIKCQCLMRKRTFSQGEQNQKLSTLKDDNKIWTIGNKHLQFHVELFKERNESYYQVNDVMHVHGLPKYKHLLIWYTPIQDPEGLVYLLMWGFPFLRSIWLRVD